MSDQEMTVSSIMKREVPIVSPDDSIAAVAKLMIDSRLPGVLVVENGALLGIVTEADFVEREAKVDLPSMVPFFSGVLEVDAGANFDEELRKITAITAEQLMTTPVFNIKVGATITELATLMVERRVNPVPVVNESLQIVGIVTRTDLARLIARLEAEAGESADRPTP